MFFTPIMSRTYITRAATLDSSIARSITPSGSFLNSLESTTVRSWSLAAGTLLQIAEWNAGFGQTYTLDGIALARCSLPGSTITLRHRNSLMDGWTVAISITPQSETAHIARRFNSVSAQYWSLLVTPGAQGGSISWLWLGEWLQFPRGPEPPFVPPSLAQTFETSSFSNNNAQALGVRSQPISGQTAFNMSNISLQWAKEHWEPVRQYLARGGPLFLMPDEVLLSEIGLVQASGSVPNTLQQNSDLASLSITFRYLP